VLTHLHGEGKAAALVLAFRERLDGAAIHLDEVLADHKPHADALAVLLGRAPQLAEHREQPMHVFVPDALPVVLHVHSEQLLSRVEGHVNAHFTA